MFANPFRTWYQIYPLPKIPPCPAILCCFHLLNFNMSILCSLFALSLLASAPGSVFTLSTLTAGSSLSVEKSEDVLISPSGIFSAGFHPVGDNAYGFAIWFNKPSCSSNCTIVWMANRDFPVNGKSSKLLLQENGNLILTDAKKSTAWSTKTESLSPSQLHLLDIGNLVLDNSEGKVLWQSFDSPTDTLLPRQPLTRDTQLVSSRGRTNLSSGFYKLFFDNDNVLSLLYDGPEISSVYWPYPWLLSYEAGRFPYNSSRTALLDNLGKFSSSDNFTALSIDYGVSLQRRLTLDFDGNVRIYSREVGGTNWIVSWQALTEPCRVHGICGPNSTCGYDPITGTKCTCLPRYKMKNTTDWAYGCEPENEVSCGNDTETRFVLLPHAEFYGYDYGYYPNYTLRMCETVCLGMCNCKAFQFKYITYGSNNDLVTACYPKILLYNGQQWPGFEGQVYVKVSTKTLFSDIKETTPISGLDCSGELVSLAGRDYPKDHENGTLKFIRWFATALGAVEMVIILFAWCFLVNSHKNSGEPRQGYHLMAAGFKRFTYSELKQATRNFSHEIGRGAGGIVYKGVLSDNRVAAIKLLNVAVQGEAEFLAEISTIGKLNHMNLIEILGYCAEGKQRLLVYEFMEHGSLAENVSSKTLDWKKRFEIALGTARGLAYLHEECLEWVLHCDVKPQNILLDSNYQPKVSDFGLSKLLNRGDRENTSFTGIRGTRGYMAPEWVFNLPITSKVDVYSYGIVILEMVTGRGPLVGSNSAQSGDENDDRTLVAWVRDKRGTANDNVSWIEDVIDPKLDGKYDTVKMETLVSLALQCVEEDKDARPTMSKAVEMLHSHENDV
ncbi:hypothetical protein K2173_026175 [Erythroxylum novogranatense]|uniref:Receptor-like serine/threonine-protein kinase n=1 Tax=Erythroxylum novogranatense TaxID=1862640 RepID=A0AAV8TBF0_9ROSI|nr:hypothetical protein K2173_026175 [Erythroxylum novogranatense]